MANQPHCQMAPDESPPGLASHGPLLHKQELADRLRVSTRTVDRWAHLGYFSVLKVGRLTYYPWERIVQELSAKYLIRRGGPKTTQPPAPTQNQR